MKRIFVFLIYIAMYTSCVFAQINSISIDTPHDSISGKIKFTESEIDSSISENDEELHVSNGFLNIDLSLNIKDIFQILFFIIIGFFTVKSFFLARKALLDPFRNILAKNLENKIAEIQLLFFEKSEYELRIDADLLTMQLANMWKIRDLYAYFFLSYDLNAIGPLSKRPYNKGKCPETKNIYNTLDHPLSMIELELEEGSLLGSIQYLSSGPEDRMEIWSTYTLNWISLPIRYVEYENKLKRLISTPYLPQKLRSLLTEYLETLSKNIILMGNQLNEYAQTLPKRYPESYPNSDLMPTIFDLDSSPMPLLEVVNKISQYLEKYYSKLRHDLNPYLE